MADRRLAVITGASSGLGAEFAKQLAERNYDVWLIARRLDKLEGLAAELSAKHGVRAEAMRADLVDPADLERVAERIAGAESLDLLVNNAGFGTMGRFFDTGLAGQMTMHQLHVLATVRLAHAALPGLVRRRRGGIINVSSVAGFVVMPSNISYCATKAWMNRFTYGMRLELQAAGSPVRVQALCPGFTYTEFHDTLGMSRDPIPKSLWMSAEFVVRESLDGLERGTLYVIPGWRYKLLVAFLRAVPDRLLEAGARRFGLRRRRR
ncbi:MAG TPA: short-chain dehydrogenase [Solibacterales bacterium]|nr:short-chain dehydrogenase [Bryobacterales bacterium]